MTHKIKTKCNLLLKAATKHAQRYDLQRGQAEEYNVTSTLAGGHHVIFCNI